MSTMRPYLEDNLGLTSLNEAGLINTFNKMKNSLKSIGEDPFRNVSSICKNPETLSILTEAIKFSPDDIAASTSQYKAEDMARLNTMYENVATSMLNEAIQSTGDLSPIMMNSFGIQERALISAHLPRAVKQVVAKIDNFKLTERIPYIIDLAGNKKKFLDAFIPNEDGTSSSITLQSSVDFDVEVPNSCVELYNNPKTSGNTGTSESVGKEQIFGFDSEMTKVIFDTSRSAVNAGIYFNPTTKTYSSESSAEAGAKVAGGLKYTYIPTTGEDPYTQEFGAESLRSPNVENGTFNVVITAIPVWTVYEYDVDAADWSATGTKVAQSIVLDSTDPLAGQTECFKAIVQGQFDMPNGQLVSISSTSSKIAGATFKMILSPETHIKALSVSYDMKHTPVNIPIGEHFEYSLSEEFKDASDKYYNVDAMAMLSDYMGKAVEQVKDIKTLGKYQELASKAVVNAVFNCTPTTGFAQGKEEYIRREFHPFIEKICIMLKNKVRIPQCHFRVLGNPLDIRLGAAAGVEYIYKRNEQFAGEISIDYEFSVTSDVHKIFYISSERVPQGKIFVFLIPNTIENNISTVNHYEYATYVSNRYKGTNTNVPTVMISTRYLTKEYYPVLASISIVNNITDGDITTAANTINGEGITAKSIYGRVQYVNA